MADLQALHVSYPEIAWDKATEAHLGRIDGASTDVLAHYRQAVENGEVTLHGIEVEYQRVGTIAYMIDNDIQGQVLFVMGMGAEPVEGVNLALNASSDFLPKRAKELGCVAVRFWTRREGFTRVLRNEGYETIYVMEKPIV